FDALAFRALIDFSRTLESLREHVEPRNRGSSDAGLGHSDRGAAADRDAQALGVVQDLLSPHPAGLQSGEIFERATGRVSRLLSAERAMLFLVAAGEQRLVARAARGFRKEDLGSISLEPGEGVVGRAFLECRLVIHPVASDEPVPDAFIDLVRVR